MKALPSSVSELWYAERTPGAQAGRRRALRLTERTDMRVKECLDTPHASYNAGFGLIVAQHMQYGQAGMRRLCELDPSPSRYMAR